MVVLVEKGIPHKVELFSKEDKPKKFLDTVHRLNINSRGTVPTIVDSSANLELTESNVISEYLDNAYAGSNGAPKLFPDDAKLLAKVKLFVELYSAEVQPTGLRVLKAENQQELDAGKEAFTNGLKVLDSFLKDHGLDGGDFLLGKDFSYAEAATIPFLYRLNVALPHYHNVDPLKIASANGLHRLQKWIKAASARPSVRETTLADETIIKNWGKFVKPFNK